MGIPCGAKIDGNDMPGKIRYDIAARYTAIGMEFALCVGLMLWAGMWLDEKMKTSPVMMLAGLILGFAAGLYWLIKQARQARRDLESMKADGRDCDDKAE